MATHITFRDPADYGGSSIMNKPRAAETLAEAGTSAATTITAKQGEIASVVSTADIYVNYGAAPTAATDTGDMLTAGSRIEIGPMNLGDKVAVITI